MIPDQVKDWLIENGYGDLKNTRPVGGGCINNGARLETASGTSFFLKTNPNAPLDMFAREAEGLEAIRVKGAPAAPRPLLWAGDFLLLEDLRPAPRRSSYWPEFGSSLAILHTVANPGFGFDHDNYIGSTPQPNPWTSDGYTFFAESRLQFQVSLARNKGLVGKFEVDQVERLAARLPELVPDQPASLIHGDLWSGNALTDSSGGPALIDPAAHFGWAEADLAMTALFGAFPENFYRAYQETRPLEPGFRERFPIYNLYHLLNHLNLFGSGYLSQVQAILRQYR